ncbi:hypothetical protein K431DRAFT_310668 [Polychaeton citri CBS 116435]|uniref:SAC domain-containing protein n=1 Tax=Polychaeton citri CBS 116435 TaxID=1314669 RepID=A0A9P4QCM7_9PEZI|nr:hypothetical protein K431DRAFT_310668 [Polychaeton citri CBS 116435]
MAGHLPYRDINVHASSTYYAFSSPSTPNAPTLIVDRPSGELRLNDGKVTAGHRVSSISGILGIIKPEYGTYIITIAKAVPVGRIKGHQVYKVLATEFLPLQNPQIQTSDEKTYIALLKDLLKAGPMYFSYTFDLTNSFQRQTQTSTDEPLWARADERFFWNKHLSNGLIDFREGRSIPKKVSSTPQPAVDPFILPVIQGMLSINSTSIKGNPLTFVLITRRSRHRAGTRYFSRGLDEQGHVSNFNETEQAVILNDNASVATSTLGSYGISNGQPSVSGKETQVLSYVQTRGSVPVYWAEINTLKYTPTLTIRGVDSAKQAAALHFDEQIRLYGENYLVNLVNQKGREQRVKEAYEQMVKILQSSSVEEQEAGSKTKERFNIIDPKEQRNWYDHLHYIYFDFHSETKGLKFHRSQLLLDQLHENLERGGYFYGIDTPKGTVDVRMKQTAVVRTNCMDCLDRTNVIQSMLGRWTLTRMLTDVGAMRPGESAQDDAKFESLFRNIWADNADVVSRSYSGTGALKTDFTRTGTRTKAGALEDLNRSITRYVRNNFLDGPRQDGFDLFLGNADTTGGIPGGERFLDRRPLTIQAVPYVLGMCVIFVLFSLYASRLPNSTIWPLRLFILVCLAIAGYSASFMLKHGQLYVNWPRLNTPLWAVETYEHTLAKAKKDPIFGLLLTNASGTRDLEDGKAKKRKE